MEPYASAPLTVSPAAPRYAPVAVFLHWTMALLIILQLVLALIMESFPSSWMGTVMMLHKSNGFLILVLALLRLGWRLTHRFPPLPSDIPRWQQIAARANHIAFYFLIIGIPLIGWLMVSATAKYPSIFFGLFEIPFLPMPAGADRDYVHEAAEVLHFWLAIALLALAVLHIAAALKHHFIDRNEVLRRMLPLWAQPRPPLPRDGNFPV